MEAGGHGRRLNRRAGLGTTTALVAVDNDAWQRELEQHADWFEKLGARMPFQLALKHDLIVARLAHAPAA